MRVVIAHTLELTDPLLPQRILGDAQTMAEQVYPLLYLLENSLRELIRRVLRNAHGDEWWAQAVPGDVRREVQRRRDREAEEPWHGRRGAPEVFYTDFGHLKRIVTSNQNWPYFQGILPSQQWLGQRLDELEMSRNTIAHCNPLQPHNIERFRIYLGDWQRQIDAVRDLIPK